MRVSRLRLPEALLSHLESEYPHEGCGVLLQKGNTGPCRVRPMRNDYAAHHETDPERHPHTPRTAFAFNPSEWLQLNLEAETHGERIVCVYHSHIDTGAYLSSEDTDWAAPSGEPLLPGVSYLVVSIVRGRAADARWYAWERGSFRETPTFPWAFTIEKPF